MAEIIAHLAWFAFCSGMGAWLQRRLTWAERRAKRDIRAAVEQELREVLLEARAAYRDFIAKEDRKP